MRTIVMWGSAVGALWLLCSPCVAEQPIYRGQNPAMYGGMPYGAAQPISYGQAPYQAGPAQPVSYAPAAGHGCPEEGYCEECHGPHCRHGWLWRVFHPRHWHHGHHLPVHHTSRSYSDEYTDRDLFVYPPTNQPPAVVQYPYYTVRGPTDFFMP